MLKKLRNAFIIWAIRRAPARRRIHSWGGDFQFSRFEFFLPDERKSGGLKYKMPWWVPFNVMLHCWDPKDRGEEFHNHLKWSATILLRGKIVERSPNGLPRVLTPGSIICRRPSTFHALAVPKGFSGKTWTLFVVGPHRRHRKRTVFKQVPRVQSPAE